jgi:uncharacterized protein YjiS (DUF1127 family)
MKDRLLSALFQAKYLGKETNSRSLAIEKFLQKEDVMLVVLEAAGMLVNRVSSEWHLAPGGPQHHFSDFRPVRRPSRLGIAVGRGLSRGIAAVREYFERRALIRELSAKDDRLLEDIGITRDQIKDVVAAAYERGPLHASRLAATTGRVHHDAVAVDQVANDNETKIAA